MRNNSSITRYLDRAVDIVHQYVELGRKTANAIAAAPDPHQALDDFLERMDFVLLPYPDDTEIGGYGVLVGKDSGVKDLNAVACILCTSKLEAVTFQCCLGDLRGDTEKGFAQLRAIGSTDEALEKAFDGVVARLCDEYKKSYVEFLAERFELIERVAHSEARH